MQLIAGKTINDKIIVIGLEKEGEFSYELTIMMDYRLEHESNFDNLQEAIEAFRNEQMKYFNKIICDDDKFQE